MEFNKKNLIQGISIMFFCKVLFPGVSYAECLGALVVLIMLNLDRVLSYLYPARIDVFKELSLVQSKLAEIQTKSDDLERDVTALKFGGLK